MEKFILIFRRPHTPSQPTAAQMPQIMKIWADWIEELRYNNQLSDNGNRLIIDEVRRIETNGIFSEPDKYTIDVISGYIIVKAETIDAAAILAQGCPILKMDGNVEVRQIL